MKNPLMAVVVFALSVLSAMPVFAQSSASVVMYHRFGDTDFPATNITMEQFEAHINEIKTGGYNVLPLNDLVDKLISGEELPDKTLAITIDDGYLSIYERAFPKFKEASIPFTIFLSTDPIDRGYAGYLSWKQVRELSDHPLVSIGAHTASHLHMAAASQARVGDEMSRSLARLEEKLGYRPDIFAYPYGEASLEAMQVVRGFGMKAAFGQHSGAVGSKDNMFYLARFALNEKYGDLKRFQMVSKAKSLFASEIYPKNMMVSKRNPPLIGFTVDEEVGNLSPLACFASHEGKVRVETVFDRRVEVRLEKALPVGRTRLNCTMPAGDGRWRWFGRQFYVAP
ncbi:polysaccharide deacetylase family protein [Terasakiella sp. A23]|uniref:polysaccharide deacetylase family protein n=1 Tax=Terasakiella sp. FCG-A23 TaxID=3080561 RepID=UPI002952D828|nr:polysaccharide deacetylase family protein [Terasakiella sp. A23]MDV7339902.1 polysaccharide deacetylase family protein [Terasakiella sp. A23]